jgi:hypothetical protein
MSALTHNRAVFALALVSAAAACRGPMPCPDCDSADDVQADDMQNDPDLPCGGADFLTDPRNCGACGNECVDYPGTEWEVGSCQMGVCTGPFWSSCTGETFGATCAEICAGYTASCVAKGCSGNTTLLFKNEGDFSWCNIPDDTPVTIDGACDEPIPWEQGFSFPTHVRCCCG